MFARFVERLMLVSLVVLPAEGTARAGDEGLSISMRVDLGRDVGQNFGSLFEARDADGKVVAGAGYLGAYNTQARSDRRLLHFYVTTPEPGAFTPVALPRVNDNAGVYLYEYDNRLFAKSRGGPDGKLRVWDAETRTWRLETDTVPFSIHVGHGVLTGSSRGMAYNGQSVLEIEDGSGILAEPYYANAFIAYRHVDHDATPPVNELVARGWTPTDRTAKSVTEDGAIAMGTPREFVYAWGQLGDHIVAATNTGGVYVFDGEKWKTLLEPDVNVSFQIYAMLNYRDKLLMGQYPTGELFEYDGRALRRREGWPPVMPGVSKLAREAQTLTIYGGEIHAGVWPWAEVWRYAENAAAWTFMGRMFTHPELTDKTTHPYEEETKRLGAVLNHWGQRVTSLVPLGDALYISTSSKGGTPYEPKFAFLADGDKWKEYGVVYRHRKPGTLVVPTVWTDGPTTFTLEVRDGRLQVTQDGKTLGTADAGAAFPKWHFSHRIRWGEGVFGKFRGRIEHRAPRAKPKPAAKRAHLGR
jgi:hypothetical protein